MKYQVIRSRTQFLLKDRFERVLRSFILAFLIYGKIDNFIFYLPMVKYNCNIFALLFIYIFIYNMQILLLKIQILLLKT